MNKTNKIMIFGGGMLQISLIKKANELGYYTIVVDPDPNAAGKNVADEFIVISGNDFKKTYETAQKNKIEGLVTTATDKPLLMMAEIAEKLDLPFSSKEAIYNTINKFELKQVLVKNEIPCAKGVLANLFELNDKIKNSGIRFPLIIKPIDSSGSRGVFYCKTKNDLLKIYSESIKYSNFDKLLIEEYLQGEEISVEAFIQDNNLNIIQITDKSVTPLPYNVEMGHVQPSLFFKEFYDEIYHILLKAVKALKLNNCALHPEMKITKNGVAVIEIGPRLGGDFITSHLTPLSTGVNMEVQLLKMALGEKINIEITENRYSSVLFFDLLKSGVNTDRLRKKIKGLKNSVSAFELYYPDLTNLPVITNSLERHGHVVFSADTLPELMAIKKQLRDEL